MPRSSTIPVERDALIQALADFFAAAEELHDLATYDQYLARIYDSPESWERFKAWAVETLPTRLEKLADQLYFCESALQKAAFGTPPKEDEAYETWPIHVEVHSRGLELAGKTYEAKRIRETGTISPPKEEKEAVSA